MAHEQLREIINRARTCARGHDFEGVLSAMTEAEGELNRAEEQPDTPEPGDGGDSAPEGTPEGTADPQGDGGGGEQGEGSPGAE